MPLCMNNTSSHLKGWQTSSFTGLLGPAARTCARMHSLLMLSLQLLKVTVVPRRFQTTRTGRASDSTQTRPRRCRGSNCRRRSRRLHVLVALGKAHYRVHRSSATGGCGPSVLPRKVPRCRQAPWLHFLIAADSSPSPRARAWTLLK